MADLVSYNQKHNELNQENNRDGRDDNVSWNSGIEGPTTNKEILKNRFRRAKSLMASLLLSKGTPMLRSGDEILQSNKGNNNLYAQDNELAWTNWETISPEGQTMLKLVRDFAQFRRDNPVIQHDNFLNTDQCTWYRPDAERMKDKDWQYFVRAISCRIREKSGNLFFIFNGFDGEIKWIIPPATKGKKWNLVLSTEKTALKENTIKVPAWSVLVLKET